MDYLLEVRWKDPVAMAITRILGSLPEGVEQKTTSMPYHTARVFSVLHAESARDLADLADAMVAAGAEVRVITSQAA